MHRVKYEGVCAVSEGQVMGDIARPGSQTWFALRITVSGRKRNESDLIRCCAKLHERDVMNHMFSLRHAIEKGKRPVTYDVLYDGSSYRVVFSRHVFDIDLGLTTSHKKYLSVMVDKGIKKHDANVR